MQRGGYKRNFLYWQRASWLVEFSSPSALYSVCMPGGVEVEQSDFSQFYFQSEAILCIAAVSACIYSRCRSMDAIFYPTPSETGRFVPTDTHVYDIHTRLTPIPEGEARR